MPVAEDLKNPAVGNSVLFGNATTVHNAIDNWIPPSGVQLTEIAGWGEETLKTIAYYQGTKGECSNPRDLNTCRDVPALDFEAVKTVDGDGTVVASSALWLPLATGVRKYWVNLRDYGASGILHSTINRSHSDIFEIPELDTFIKNLSTRNSELPIYISESEPAGKAGDIQLHFTLHSPLSLDLYDDLGNHTGVNADGVVEEDIPGSRYSTFGGQQYISVPSSANLHLSMKGKETGSFTLKVEEKEGNTTIAQTMFAGVPSVLETTATMEIPAEGGIAGAGNLIVDEYGDGKTVLALAPKEGETVLPDLVPPQTATTTTGTLGTNGWYISDVTVKLTATDNDSGVKNTLYSLDKGLSWKTYATPVVISSEGTSTLQLYSVDNIGNKEATSTLLIKIDKTAPAANVSVDTNTKDLVVLGNDNLSATTVVKNTDNSYLITDQAGHKTKLFFTKTYLGKLLSIAKMTGVQYDTATKIPLPSSSFLYIWNIFANPQTLLSQTIVVNDTYGIEAVYDKSKNQTTVLLKKKGTAIQTRKFTGLRVIQLTVDKGIVSYVI